MSDPLRIDLGRGLVLSNPVGLASGTAGYGFELAQLMDIRRVGALYTKGTTRQPRAGNAPPRVAETAAGMLNSIGLQNPGVDVVAHEYAPRMAAWGIAIVVNVAGGDIDDYVHCVRCLEAASDVAGIELNISCPNIAGGLDFGRDPAAAARLVDAVRAVTERHLMVKLSPNVTSIGEVATAVEAAGADSVSAVNTYVGTKLHSQRGTPVLDQRTGGVSGPAIHPLAVAAVAAVVAAVRIPVVGAGGIDSVESALDFLRAGARAVQVGTANFVDPGLAVRIVEALHARAASGAPASPASDHTVHRTAVRLLVLDDQDALLLLHYRTPDTGEDFWCTPGGALEPGECIPDAARREFAEETGQPLPALGQEVWQREHRFRVGDGRLYVQREHYHVTRVRRFSADMRAMGEFERSALVDHRWWTLAELRSTSAVLQPPALADLVERVLNQRTPPVAAEVGPARGRV